MLGHKSKDDTIGAWRDAEEHGLIQIWVKGYRGVQKSAEAEWAQLDK